MGNSGRRVSIERADSAVARRKRSSRSAISATSKGRNSSTRSKESGSCTPFEQTAAITDDAGAAYATISQAEGLAAAGSPGVAVAIGSRELGRSKWIDSTNTCCDTRRLKNEM